MHVALLQRCNVRNVKRHLRMTIEAWKRRKISSGRAQIRCFAVRSVSVRSGRRIGSAFMRRRRQHQQLHRRQRRRRRCQERRCHLHRRMDNRAGATRSSRACCACRNARISHGRAHCDRRSSVLCGAFRAAFAGRIGRQRGVRETKRRVDGSAPFLCCRRRRSFGEFGRHACSRVRFWTWRRRW